MSLSSWLATLWGVAALVLAGVLLGGGPTRSASEHAAGRPEGSQAVGESAGGPIPSAPRESASAKPEPQLGGDSTGGRPTTNAEDADPEPQWARAVDVRPEAERDPGRWPEDGEELMAMGLPLVDSVAGVLKEARVEPEALRRQLRAVVGHVQRLELFRGMAEDDRRRVREAEEARASGGEAAEGRFPPREVLQRMADSGSRQVMEYEEYVRRSLARDLGITDDAIFRRIVELAVPPSQPPGEPGGLPEGASPFPEPEALETGEPGR